MSGRNVAGSLSFIGASAVSAAVMLAGLLKIWEIQSFRTSLETWTSLPGPVRDSAAVLVPLLEVGLGAAWLLGLARRRTTMLLAIMIASYSGVYFWHLVLGARPDCNCFGTLLKREADAAQFPVILARNTALIGLLLWYFLDARIEPRPLKATIEQVDSCAV